MVGFTPEQSIAIRRYGACSMPSSMRWRYLMRVTVGFGLNAVNFGRTFVTIPLVES